MKPPEILSLLEEAAGTRMYEKKKEAALRTLDKKQERLAQIDMVGDGGACCAHVCMFRQEAGAAGTD
jgi:hypothetical protein